MTGRCCPRMWKSSSTPAAGGGSRELNANDAWIVACGRLRMHLLTTTETSAIKGPDWPVQFFDRRRFRHSLSNPELVSAMFDFPNSELNRLLPRSKVYDLPNQPRRPDRFVRQIGEISGRSNTAAGGVLTARSLRHPECEWSCVEPPITSRCYSSQRLAICLTKRPDAAGWVCNLVALAPGAGRLSRLVGEVNMADHESVAQRVPENARVKKTAPAVGPFKC